MEILVMLEIDSYIDKVKLECKLLKIEVKYLFLGVKQYVALHESAVNMNQWAEIIKYKDLEVVLVNKFNFIFVG